MKRAQFIAIILLCALSSLGGDARGTGTTHIWGPSTDVQGYGLWHVTADLYLPTSSAADGSHIASVTNLGLTVGVIPSSKVNLEIGFDHKSGLGVADAYPLYGNAKLGIPEHAFGHGFPALAVGIFDFGTKSDMTDYSVIYSKVAKSIAGERFDLGRVSLGYFTANDKLLLDDKGEKDNSGVMAAWERTMTEISPKLWLCVEYMGTQSAYGTMNIGAAWKFADNVGVLIGYDMFNNDDFVDTFTLQVDIDFRVK